MKRVVALAVVASCLVGTSSRVAVAKTDTPIPAPLGMAVIGDSISVGYALGRDWVYSWAGGTEINSHAMRLRKLNPSMVIYSAAAPGATMGGFASQAASVVGEGPMFNYVTVDLGGADVCLPLGGTTPSVESFRAAFRSGLDTLTEGLPDVHILVVSIFNLRSMQNAMLADGRPGTTAFCAPFFANPGSTNPVDVARRNQVMRTIRTFNEVIRKECAKVSGCKSDGGAMFRHKWRSDEIGPDGIHPTIKGQKMMARVTWKAGFTWRALCETSAFSAVQRKGIAPSVC